MPSGHDQHRTDRASGLRRTIRFARWRMAGVIRTEQILLRAAPLLGILALFLILSWLGFFRLIPDWLRIVSLKLFGVGLISSFWPLRKIGRTGLADIDKRLERQNLIAHQAVATQEDSLEANDPFARALWAEHQKRMAGTIETLSAGSPRTSLPERDPYGLRVAIALLLVTAFAFSWSGQAGRLSDAFTSHSAPAPGLRIDAWISPPSYVSKPPIFLEEQTPSANDEPAKAASTGATPVNAVAGSMVTVRIGGKTEAAVVSYLNETGQIIQLEPKTSETWEIGAGDDARASVYGHELRAGGTLLVDVDEVLRKWPIAVTPDLPPVLAFTEKPRRTVSGALEISYTITDDFGIAEAQAEIVPLQEHGPDALPLYDPPVYRLTLPRRNSKDGKATSSHDLTEHPLAGQKVRITLTGTDGAGQTGRSKSVEMTLPGRYFSQPLAAAVAELRSLLALDANNIPRIMELHDALTLAPEETIPNLSHFLLLESIKGRIRYARTMEDLRNAVDYMWGVALQIEDGNLSLAQRELRNAQAALAEALKNGADDQEIARLMDQLRKAMQDYLEELARRISPMEGNQERMAQNILRQQDLETMLDQIENLARSGAREQAQQMLSELQRMMNNLQAGRQQRPTQEGGPLRKKMDQLGELVRRQQQLMDRTFELDSQRRYGPPPGEDNRQEQGRNNSNRGMDPGEGRGQRGGGQGEQEPGSKYPGGKSLEERLGELGKSQQSLREELGRLQQELQGLGIKPSEGFGEAGKAMGDAAGNLEGGETEGALSDQARALQALRAGAQDIMNQMMQAMGTERGNAEGEGPGRAGNPNAGRDPLGRPRAGSGPDYGDRVKVPDEIDVQRAREILETIRKRLGDKLSPEVERLYLERLLDLR